MNDSVTFVEVNIFERMVPLTSGYLQSYASKKQELKNTFDFHKISTTVHEYDQQLLDEVLELDSRVYALSCYLWNMRIMQQIAKAIVEAKPDAYVLMGGPQVMHYGHKYLDENHENFMICDGEGEITFSNFLSEVLSSTPDFSNVKGLSFYRNGHLITTDSQPRLKSLNEIPSPFTNGLFDKTYKMAVMETNRGCPFRCTYCYWGAATNDKVFKFDEDRLRDEILWLGEHQVPILYIADANWGMLKRDIGLSKHIADSKNRFGMPFYVNFSAAKNSPERVSEISSVFDQVGMMNSQPVSLQTMSQIALAKVERSNIKTEAYQTLQQELNTNGISSFIELIWPLPGETLSSFKKGIDELCVMNASSLMAYPNLLLHNTPMYHNQEALGIETRTVRDHASEAELIISTREVPYNDFKEGIMFFYVALALYNTRALERTTKWLNDKGILSYAEYFEQFVEFCRASKPNQFIEFCSNSIENDRYYEITNYQYIYHLSLHAQRNEFDKLLFEFSSQQPWWSEREAQFNFELDLLSKMYLYSNTPMANYEEHISLIRIDAIQDRTVVATIPNEFLAHIASDLHDDGQIVLNHKRGQYPYRDTHTRERDAQYCAGRIQMINSTVPEWKSFALEAPVGFQ